MASSDRHVFSSIPVERPLAKGQEKAELIPRNSTRGTSSSAMPLLLMPPTTGGSGEIPKDRGNRMDKDRTGVAGCD